MTKSSFYPKILTHVFEGVKSIVMKDMHLTSGQFDAMDKAYLDDGAPGHDDKVGSTVVKDWFDEKARTSKLKRSKGVPNGSDMWQVGDLGINKEISQAFALESSRYLSLGKLTPKGHPQLPGQECWLGTVLSRINY